MSQLPPSVNAVVIGGGIQKGRPLEAMVEVTLRSADAPRFATGDRHW
jgi:hypothetical protein